MDRHRIFRSLTLTVVITLLASVSGRGQATSSLRGSIADASGAVIEGVAVQLIGDETSFQRSVLTDASGEYQFPLIPPGTYSLVAERPGFAIAALTGVELRVNTPATLNVVMEVAAVTETVTVQAQTETINSVDATIGNAFNQTQVRQLPLLTRNVVELLSLQPGVTPTGEVVGARRDQNNVTLDGVDVNDNQTAGLEVAEGGASNVGFNAGRSRPSGFNAALPVPLDSVQEFRVTVGGQNANQGRSSGGQVTLVTKSGSNEFHGSLYEYHRNTATSANDWFNNRAGVERERLIRNQFGGSFGGPIARDRLFFFGNYEQRIDASAESQLRRVPSETLRQGMIMVRTNDGQTRTLTPAQIAEIDPLGAGVSQAMLEMFQQMPVGNDPASGLDRGLNFSGFRFNAATRLDSKAYVAKLDWSLDPIGLHTVSLRGTLADGYNDEVLAQYPGQDPTARLLNNSRGLSAVYTGVLTPTLVSVSTFGLTRIGLERTGSQSTSFTHDSIDSLEDYSRGYTRIAPTYNIANDTTWTKGTHTVSFGANVRFVRNDRVNYANSFESYSFGRGSLGGLGADITSATEAYLAGLTGDSAIRVVDSPSLSRAFGNVLGLVTTGRVTYNYTLDGTAQPVGVPVVRNFASNEFEMYVGDSWRATPALTLTYGLRYVNYGVPYERNGLQVAPTFPLQEFRAERFGTMDLGIPSNALPHARLAYDFIGPANGQDSWYAADNNNFAPRLAFAYNPEGQGFIGKLLGSSGVIRGGASIMYDRFGSDLVTQFDRAASFGLSEVQNTGTAPNFTTANRFYGVLPELAPATVHEFPFTPPEVDYFGSNYMGIATDLKTPYSIAMNLSVAREVPGGMTVEVSYAGRLSRGLPMQIDTGGWAILFRDQASGLTWKDMATEMRNHHNAGIDPRAVQADPGLIPTNAFVENMWPGLEDHFFTGSASANYYQLLWGQMAGSDADAMHVVDRLRSAKFPNCISITGCWTFFAVQSSGNSMWTNVGFADFHGGTLSIRKPFSRGLSFDLNYTLSHSIDNGVTAEAGGGTHGGIMLHPFEYGAFRGSSDFDIRHNLNGNILYELPFASNATGWVEQVAGGWQISSIMRYRSGLPSSVSYSGIWPTNFSHTTIAYAEDPYDDRVGFNEFGNPSLFATVDEAANWQPMYPGEVGTRAAVRLDDYVNVDMSVTKVFPLPIEGHRLQFRAEAFNAFNNVNFTRLSLNASSPSNFGQFTEAEPARVMQFALRYEF